MELPSEIAPYTRVYQVKGRRLWDENFAMIDNINTALWSVL